MGRNLGVSVAAAMLAAMASAYPACGQRFSGTGQHATALFALPEGLAVWELEHTGANQFVVHLLDERGTLVEELVNQTGPFRGSKAVRVPRIGRYLFDVVATGSWAIRLRGSTTDTVTVDPIGSQVGAVSDSVYMLGTYEGEQQAKQVGAVGWMGSGLLGGALLGPIGAGVVFALAASRDAEVPPKLRSELAGRDPRYAESFSESFRLRLRRDRRVAAIVGGATGTLVFGFVVLQIANWSDSEGEPPGNGGGEVP